MNRRQALECGIAGLGGLLFGLGLLHSGMANPAKVLAFLDLAGNWDPSLALVMAAAVGVGFAGYWRIEARRQSVLGFPMKLPANRVIDRPLVVGAIAFGLGWGLAGFCPGPALVSLAAGSAKAGAFVLAMLAGMGLFEWTSRRKES